MQHQLNIMFCFIQVGFNSVCYQENNISILKTVYQTFMLPKRFLFSYNNNRNIIKKLHDAKILQEMLHNKRNLMPAQIKSVCVTIL